MPSRARIDTLEAANTYLREQFIPAYNATFTRPPADPTSAFVPLGAVDLEQILCEEDGRVVGQDNTVVFEGVRLQLAKQPGRPSCAGWPVVVRRHLDGTHTVWRGAHCRGRFKAGGGDPLPAVVERGLTGRFQLAGANLPPRAVRPVIHRSPSPRRRIGPRLPVGPGV